MNTKSILITVFTLGFAILMVIPAAAGGWAVISLDELPDKIIAGESLEVGFTVRQHGVNPMADLAPSVIVTHAETFESFSVKAQSQGDVGHYIAKLNFPQEGLWDWSIRAFTMEQPMPPLTVVTAPAEQVNTGSILFIPIGIISLGLLAMVTGATAVLFLLTGKKVKWAVALLILALLFTGGGFALAASQPQVATSETMPARSLTEQGEALFLSKGCITCHRQVKVAAKFDVVSGISGPTGLAPDLSEYSASPEFLRLWLANPAKVKPNTNMPDLGLTTDEIEAFIAFLVKDSISASPEALIDFPPKSCPVTQPQVLPFIPPSPYPSEAASDGQFWYGTDDLWTMLLVDGVWMELPYHKEGGGHYINKLFWWNKDYDWQSEPIPAFTVTARRLDGPAFIFETSEATNAYTPEFGSAILTGIEIPTPGCWEFTGSYRDHELSFVVWVVP